MAQNSRRSGKTSLPANPDYAHRAEIDRVPKERLCQCCGGDAQRDYEPLRYRPKLKLWLCTSCRELHEPELLKDDESSTRPDRAGSAIVGAVRKPRRKGGK